MTGIVAQNVGRPSGLIKAASGGGGVWTLIKSITVSNDSTISFVDGASDVVLDSTYPIYVFKFINIDQTSGTYVNFLFNGSTDTGSNYNVTKTSSAFRASQNESDDTQLAYQASQDLKQSTGFQEISHEIKSDADGAASGELRIFGISSTTFVKHYISTVNAMQTNPGSMIYYIAGYMNTTSAVDAFQFKMSSGNINAGKIKLYGLKESA